MFAHTAGSRPTFAYQMHLPLGAPQQKQKQQQQKKPSELQKQRREELLNYAKPALNVSTAPASRGQLVHTATHPSNTPSPTHTGSTPGPLMTAGPLITSSVPNLSHYAMTTATATATTTAVEDITQRASSLSIEEPIFYRTPTTSIQLRIFHARGLPRRRFTGTLPSPFISITQDGSDRFSPAALRTAPQQNTCNFEFNKYQVLSSTFVLDVRRTTKIDIHVYDAKRYDSNPLKSLLGHVQIKVHEHLDLRVSGSSAFINRQLDDDGSQNLTSGDIALELKVMPATTTTTVNERSGSPALASPPLTTNNVATVPPASINGASHNPLYSPFEIPPVFGSAPSLVGSNYPANRLNSIPSAQRLSLAEFGQRSPLQSTVHPLVTSVGSGTPSAAFCEHNSSEDDDEEDDDDDDDDNNNLMPLALSSPSATTTVTAPTVYSASTASNYGSLLASYYNPYQQSASSSQYTYNIASAFGTYQQQSQQPRSQSQSQSQSQLQHQHQHQSPSSVTVQQHDSNTTNTARFALAHNEDIAARDSVLPITLGNTSPLLSFGSGFSSNRWHSLSHNRSLPTELPRLSVESSENDTTPTLSETVEEVSDADDEGDDIDSEFGDSSIAFIPRHGVAIASTASLATSITTTAASHSHPSSTSTLAMDSQRAPKPSVPLARTRTQRRRIAFNKELPPPPPSLRPPSDLPMPPRYQDVPGLAMPTGWVILHTIEGKVYFGNQATQESQWADPRTNSDYQNRRSNRNSRTNYDPGLALYNRKLPDNWEVRFTYAPAMPVTTNNQQRHRYSQLESGEWPYFVDHATRNTTWDDPRIPALASGNVPQYKRDFNRKYAMLVQHKCMKPVAGKCQITVRREHIFEDTFAAVLKMEESLGSGSFAIPNNGTSSGSNRYGLRLNIVNTLSARMRNTSRATPTPATTTSTTTTTTSTTTSTTTIPLIPPRTSSSQGSFSASSAVGNELRKTLHITFAGELGVDHGGVAREFFTLLSQQMFNPDYNLFVHPADDESTIMISPNSDVNPSHLLYYKFIGRMMATAVFHGKLLVSAFFGRSFYRMLLGHHIGRLEDMQSIDDDLHRSYEWLLHNDIGDGSDIEQYFCVDYDRFGQTITRDLIPDGRRIMVTDDNKKEFVEKAIHFKVKQQINSQLRHIVDGFNEVLPLGVLRSIFDERDLELLMCGLGEICLDDWMAQTHYEHYKCPTRTASEPPADPACTAAIDGNREGVPWDMDEYWSFADCDVQIEWFWRCVHLEMNREMRNKLLQFVTGTSRIPAGGFRDLQGKDGPRKFTIMRVDDRSNLPRSSTCMNTLRLPAYRDYETLKSKLIFAILETDTFGEK